MHTYFPHTTTNLQQVKQVVQQTSNTNCTTATCTRSNSSLPTLLFWMDVPREEYAWKWIPCFWHHCSKSLCTRCGWNSIWNEKVGITSIFTFLASSQFTVCPFHAFEYLNIFPTLLLVSFHFPTYSETACSFCVCFYMFSADKLSCFPALSVLLCK